MDPLEFASLIISNLSYTPNGQQTQVVGVLSRFCSPAAPSDAVFMLNGYAGTGKTSLCGALVKSLAAVGIQSVLLAPTGRAAKVFGAFACHPAYTIHRTIYRHPAAGALNFSKRDTVENRHRNTVFIVDEASMITGGDASGYNLLEDLIHYVYTGDNCRMILLGDTAQLPPVGSDFSPALSPEVLKSYGLRVTRVTLTEIARQGSGSGILYNATWLRKAMRVSPLPAPEFFTDFPDVKEVAPEDVPEELYTVYNADGVQESIVITRSNQRAVGFNREIRASVLYFEEELSRGEMLIVAKNNYFWSEKIKEINFIANGDIVEVHEVTGYEEKYGFRFADAVLGIPETDITFPAKLMLETLNAETAGMSQERYNQLYYSIMEDPELFGPYTPADARLKALRKNPYWNALQVKYAYAVTCHKAQGGQWKNVFVDASYIPPDAMGLDFYRWLYTAVTRASSRLYLIRN